MSDTDCALLFLLSWMEDPTIVINYDWVFLSLEEIRITYFLRHFKIMGYREVIKLWQAGGIHLADYLCRWFFLFAGGILYLFMTYALFMHTKFQRPRPKSTCRDGRRSSLPIQVLRSPLSHPGGLAIRGQKRAAETLTSELPKVKTKRLGDGSPSVVCRAVKFVEDVNITPWWNHISHDLICFKGSRLLFSKGFPT